MLATLDKLRVGDFISEATGDLLLYCSKRLHNLYKTYISLQLSTVTHSTGDCKNELIFYSPETGHYHFANHAEFFLFIGWLMKGDSYVTPSP